MKRGLFLVAALFMVAGVAQAQTHHWPLDSDGSDIADGLDLTVNGTISGGALQCGAGIDAIVDAGGGVDTSAAGPGSWSVGLYFSTTLEAATIINVCGEEEGGISEGGLSLNVGFEYGDMPGLVIGDYSWVGPIWPDDEEWTVNDGEEHHLAVINDAGTVTSYIDGEAYGAFGDSLPDVQGDNTWLVIGDGWIGDFEGTVRDVRFYDEAVDPADMMTPPAPSISASIVGPHNVDVGAEVVLEVVTEGFDEGTETYLWDDDSTAATLDLGVVDAGDTGVYTCEVSGDVGEEPLEEPIEASFTLWVGVATPLAGGLGVALLAGACALAGAVSIRRKK